MTSPLLRILLAVYLAIWSPAICCCAMKAVIGRVTGCEVADCSERAGSFGAAVEMRGDEQQSAPEGCCAHRQSKIDASCLLGEAISGDGAADQPKQPAPCRCHESLDSAVRLDTGAKITLPGLMKIDAHAAMVMMPMARVSRPVLVVIVDRSHQRERDLPPLRTTLLDQRCLLLI
jgi:hypothetical protein